MADEDVKTGQEEGGSKQVPLEALEATRKEAKEAKAEAARLREQLAELNGKVSTLQSGKQAGNQERSYTRAELNAAVKEGLISEDERDAYIEGERDRKVEKKIAEAVEERVRARESSKRIGDAVKEYTSLVPDVMEEGSKARAKVAAEFKYLVDEIGMPNDAGTELVALRNALGPIETLKRRQALRGERETMQETASMGEEPEGGAERDTWPKGMTQKAKDYYDDQIKKGQFKDRKAVVAMIEKAPRESRERLGLAA